MPKQKVDHSMFEQTSNIIVNTLSDKYVALHFEAEKKPGGEFDITVYHVHTPDIDLAPETIEAIKNDIALIRSTIHWVTEIKIKGLKV